MISQFTKEYFFLSNFYRALVYFEGLFYPTSENAFQAAKCIDEKERVQFTSISPERAKRLGRKVDIREDWEDVKIDVMYRIVKDKFTRNPELTELLLATYPKELQEGNYWHDTFWGVDCKTGNGENNLGKILMRVRDELMEICSA